MNATETPKADTTAKPTNHPSPSESESEPIAIQDRLVVALFLIVGFLLGIIILMDLFVGFFR